MAGFMALTGDGWQVCTYLQSQVVHTKQVELSVCQSSINKMVLLKITILKFLGWYILVECAHLPPCTFRRKEGN